MIRDLSLTLRSLLDDPALASSFPELAAAQVVFYRPDEQFSPAQTTVDLFLYDIRENLELRSSEPRLERHNAEAISIRRRCASPAPTCSPPGRSAAGSAEAGSPRRVE